MTNFNINVVFEIALGTSRWGGKFFGPSLRGATFNLAQGVNENGSIRWIEGVNAPPIFSTATDTLNLDGIDNPKGIQGKTAYLKYSAYGTENSFEEGKNYSLNPSVFTFGRYIYFI